MVGAETLDCAAGLSHHYHFLYSPQSVHETYLAVMYMVMYVSCACLPHAITVMSDVNGVVLSSMCQGSKWTHKGVVLLGRLRRTAGGVPPLDTTVLVPF